MKNTLLFVVLLANGFLQSRAQPVPMHQADSSGTNISQLLPTYYDIKNALVAGNANAASMKAEEFTKLLNGIDIEIVNEALHNALLKDATQILENKDIIHQRVYFSTFSTNMVALAKTLKLTTQPVYYAYCPMKKAYWLSSDAVIKNPYFGSAMLTCGSVKETLK